MTIYAHHDPDGVISAYLLSLATDDGKVEFPEEFGDTSGIKPFDYMVDMRPDDPSKEFSCIDHHPRHSEDREYSLIYDNEPASLIVYNNFKHQIPEEEHWKTVIGAVGDYQAYKIPVEIWENNPMLLRLRKTWSGKSYGKIKTSHMPIYKSLSSPINALCRIGQCDKALKIIHRAENPLHIIENQDALKAKSKVKSEFNSLVENCKILYYGAINFVTFNSKYRMSGYMAAALENNMNKTILAMDTGTGSLSVRGDLVRYIQHYSPQDETLFIDGHDEAAGGHCPNREIIMELLEEIT